VAADHSNLKISVVIPNYNGAHLLPSAIESCEKSLAKAKLSYEILVADDASTDESIAVVQKNYPNVKVIANSPNGGFSKNINSGLKLATGQYVFAMNTDVVLDPEYFVKSLPFLEDDRVFGTSGAMKDPGSGTLTDGAKVLSRSWFGDVSATKNARSEDYAVLPTMYLSGANALMDRLKLQQVGYFNEAFSPFYGEDTDLGLVAWRMGWRCLWVPSAIAHHKTSSTILKFNRPRKIRVVARRNKLVFHYIHLAGLQRVTFFLKVGFDLATRWISGDFVYYQGFVQFIQRFPEIRRCRRPCELAMMSTEAALERFREAWTGVKVKVF
jgi:GT2 family glycosyltransferase